MDVPAPPNQSRSETESEEAASDPIVTCHQPRPGKIVFTERKNCDAWIAIDYAVDLES